MLISGVQGKHLPNNGEGLTLEDLRQLLNSIPARARRDTYITYAGKDVIGLHFGQSDQAEPTEFTCHVVLDEAQP